MKTFKEFVKLNEEMVAGDTGGNPQNIASGTTSGAVVNKGPETLPKKKRDKSKPET
ncbi:major capsid protein [Klebsiella phage KP179]|jgi:hypothetical protein|uniref:Major capsid protein n=1 Tax=Klebsiella phage KP179 TaxID=2315700 RepID=A0A386K962_9CAUD|nr:major capsid protein [Klebsiella phage KP179]AYD80854.1 major capsid protein [Klebsiella phage KP179]UJP30217.1 hypothetical protein [Klebsiella phage Kpn6N]